MERTYVLRHGTCLGHDEDVLAFQNLGCGKSVGNLDRHEMLLQVLLNERGAFLGDLIANLLAEFLGGLLRLARKLARNDDRHVHEQVTALVVATEHREAIALDTQGLPWLAALRNVHGDFLVFENAADGDICADHGLDDGDVCTRVEIVAIALEVFMRINANRCDQIASRCTLHASLAAILDANLLAIVYAEGDLDREVFAVGNTSLALAFGAGFVDGTTVPPQSGQVTAVCISPRKVCCTLTT